MDKVFTVRLDERYLPTIDWLVRRLKTSKKQVIELAVAALEQEAKSGALKIDETKDPFDHSFGAWKEDAISPEDEVIRVRKAFEQSVKRHLPKQLG